MKYINNILSSSLWFFLSIYFLSTGFANELSAQELLIDKIVAKVGDNIVLKSEIEIQVAQAAAQGYQGSDAACQVLDQLLLEKMFLTHAEIDSIIITDEEVNAELESRMAYFISMFGGDTEKLESYYGKSIPEIKESFREDLKNQLLAQRMQQKVLSNVKVTPAEVKAFFNEIPKDSIPYFNAEVEIGQLVINPKMTAEQKGETRQTLLDLKKQVESGEPFDNLAAIYSEDPGSAANGGRLGWMERGQLVPEFEGAAYQLKAGELSNIVETQYGLHLIKLIERRGEKINVQHILIKPKVSDKELEQAKEKLDSIRQLMMADTLKFKDAVEKYSDDELTRTGGGYILNQQTGSSIFEIDQLDPTLYFIIDTLQEGQTSVPVEFEKEDGSKAYRLLHIYGRTKPHLANLEDDYDKIQAVVQNRKQQITMLNWLEKKAPKTFIEIDDEYQICPTIEKWLVKE